jgi:hypothetical protein
VTLSAIARKAKIPLAQLREHVEDRFDILAAWGRIIDRQVLEDAGESDPGTPVRDRLFDLLMARFDALNEHRDAARAVLKSMKCDPKQAVICLPHLCRSMAWMLDAAGEETAGIKGVLKVAGLTALYLKTLRVWAEDESADLAKTMAALDASLSHTEIWAERCGMNAA